MCVEIITSSDDAVSTCRELANAYRMKIKKLPIAAGYPPDFLPSANSCLCCIDLDAFAQANNESASYDGIFVIMKKQGASHD